DGDRSRTPNSLATWNTEDLVPSRTHESFIPAAMPGDLTPIVGFLWHAGITQLPRLAPRRSSPARAGPPRSSATHRSIPRLLADVRDVRAIRISHNQNRSPCSGQHLFRQPTALLTEASSTAHLWV